MQLGHRLGNVSVKGSNIAGDKLEESNKLVCSHRRATTNRAIICRRYDSFILAKSLDVLLDLATSGEKNEHRATAEHATEEWNAEHGIETI